jgi:hypothetical protein
MTFYDVRTNDVEFQLYDVLICGEWTLCCTYCAYIFVLHFMVVDINIVPTPNGDSPMPGGKLSQDKTRYGTLVCSQALEPVKFLHQRRQHTVLWVSADNDLQLVY